MASENQRLVYLAQVAQLYYEQGKTEAEIASQLKISPDEVSTLLEEARQQDVVTFHVRHPWQTDSALEDELTSVFKLKAARVLKRGERSYEEMLTDLGTLAAHYFQKILKPDSTIGISWGSALYQMIQAIHPTKMPDVEVVQLIGATGTENMAADGPLLAQLLANRLGSLAKYLHAPLLVSSEAGRDALLQERSIRETLARAEAVSIALVGIGTTDPSLYSLLRAGYVTEQDVDRLRRSGAVGDVCAQHFNENGEWLNIDTNRRVIGIRLDTIRKVDTVIGVAGGPEKTRAILAALRGQYVNVLVTDDQTAHAILAMQRGEKPAYVEAPRESKAAEVPLVSLKGVWKVFSGVPVLRGVDIELCPGQVHALLGGNGSGKSTLMKILSGIYQADAGAVELDGSPIDLEGPAFAHAHGIYLVPQEPKIFPHLSVMENLLVGSTLDPTETREKVQRLAESLGFEGGLNDPAGSLNIANQQILEIMRGLIRNLRVLILDEPTSTLTFREVESLFNRMRKLTSQGIGIFFISHRLNEILEISDYVSVLRDGNFVLSAPTAALTSRDLIRAMLPESSESENGNGSAPTTTSQSRFGDVVLDVNGMSGEMFREISLNVRAGEVVGLAGLVGAGRTELAEAILGLDPDASGKVVIAGKSAQRRNPELCQHLGLVYLPEDRHTHGIFLDRPYIETATSSVLGQLGRPLLSSRREKTLGQSFVEQLQIKATGLFQQARTLSGGNQQKVVLAKCLASKPRVIILDEPTRGVDAKARQDVYHLVQKLTDQGLGVLLISSDLEEVIQLSDRVYIMYHGRIVEELMRNDCQMERITAASFGIKDEL